MNPEQEKNLIEMLLKYVDTIVKDPGAKPEELAILPAIARVLWEMTTP